MYMNMNLNYITLCTYEYKLYNLNTTKYIETSVKGNVE